MIVTGRIFGNGAQRHPSHSYRVPVSPEWLLVPQKEAPRPTLDSEFCIDYRVTLESVKDDPRIERLRVWLEPSKYSRSREPALVYEAKVDRVHYKQHVSEAVRAVFA